MPIVELSTFIGAPRERVFDLARSIDAHQHTTGGTDERAVAGITSGLIGMNDEVTWEARHFGVRQRLTVRVTAFDRPTHFQDIMISGAFKRMVHDHTFAEHPSGTLMCDRFEFTSPLGLLGRIADRLFLEGHMRRFLVGRNAMLKRLAESSEGDRYLGQSRSKTEPRTAPCMAGVRHVETALRHYEHTRRPRTTGITKDSWRYGSLGQWENSFGCWVRNTLTNWTPGAVSLRLMDNRVSYVLPQLPHYAGSGR